MAIVTGGFKSTDIESRAKVEPDTHQYVGRYRQGLDVVSQFTYFLVASDSVEASSTETVIVATAHGARKGDVISFTSGNVIYDFVFVQSVATDAITLSQKLVAAPSPGDTFDILRPVVARSSSSGAISVAFTESPTASTSTTSSVSGSASSVQLLASNGSRKSASIYNDSSASLYVKFGTTASTTDFKYLLGPRDTLEFPTPIYTGRVDGIWSSASGAARIAEET